MKWQFAAIALAVFCIWSHVRALNVLAGIVIGVNVCILAVDYLMSGRVVMSGRNAIVHLGECPDAEHSRRG